MSVYGSKSKTTKIIAEFRHARFFQDESVARLTNGEFYGKELPDGLDPDQLLYHDLKVDKEGKPVNLKQYEGTDRDCYVAFKRTRIGADDTPLRELLYHQDMVNWPEYRKAVADGMSAEDANEFYLKDAERTEPIYARAEYFTRKMFGPYLQMPDDIQNKDIYGDPKDESNPDVYGPDDNVPPGIKPNDLYEYAGKIPPISYEAFEVWDIATLVEYLNFMDAVHGGRSPVQEATFPAGDVPADDEPPVPHRRGSKGKKPA